MRYASSVAAVGLVAALGCGGRGEAATTDPLRKVRVSFSPHISWGPIMIAQAEGFFRDEGLEVELIRLGRPEETLVALIKGDIDIRPGPIHAVVLSAIAQGAPVKIAAGMGNLVPNTCTYFGIVLRTGLDTAGAPAIKRMRASQEGPSRYIVDRLLATRNIRIRDIETPRIPDAILHHALENRSIDAAAVSEPALTRLKTVGTMWMSGEDATPDFQWAVLTFGERLLKRERDTGMRFVRAYQRGVTQYRQGKTDRNVAIIAEATGETPEHTRETCWPEFTPDSRINWESIAAFQRWARAEGIMERSVTLAQAFDSSFVTAAAAALHTGAGGKP